MRRPKILWILGTAILISVLLMLLLGNGIQATNNGQGKGNALSVTANTVTGGTCAESSIYHPGQEIVFRIWVADKNGIALTGEDVASVVVTLPEGQILYARYGGHPHSKPTEWFWTAAWPIPPDYRVTGSLPYQVAATALNGDMGRFNNVNSILILSPE